MIENISGEAIAAMVRQALQEDMIREEDTLLLFQDMDCLASRIAHLTSCFPATTLHALAIKSNPLIRLLEFTKGLGTGVEAATMGEISIALHTGYLPRQIVFDSPAKTYADLTFALQSGVHVNIDNLEEARRIDSLLKNISSNSTFGIRINPQVGYGSILESSVADDYSKFGVPVKTRRRELEEAFINYPWLTGVHLHVGSQGCAMEMLVEGVGILYDFVLQINEIRKAKYGNTISVFDIGGGLPISYHSGQVPPRMEDYVTALKERAPLLFGGQGTGGQADSRGEACLASTGLQEKGLRIITEFGRWVYVNSGFTVSRIEYVKQDPGIKTAMIHAGADLFVRECLSPSNWHHEYSVLDSHGQLKTGKDDTCYNLAGPLCFSGDIVAKNVTLPEVEPGDLLVVHDTGGYTFSMWSRYNSRQTPRILGWQDGKLSILKERENLDDLIRFWG